MGDTFTNLVCRASQYDSFEQFCKDWFIDSVEYMKMAWDKAKEVSES